MGWTTTPAPLWKYAPELGEGVTIGDALLAPHTPYAAALRAVLPLIKGAAHITGGGLAENMPRILPPGLGARFDAGAWRIPPIFTLLQARGGISRDEMYRVFNMGVGMALVCDRADVDEVAARVAGASVVGVVAEYGEGERVVVL